MSLPTQREEVERTGIITALLGTLSSSPLNTSVGEKFVGACSNHSKIIYIVKSTICCHGKCEATQCHKTSGSQLVGQN